MRRMRLSTILGGLQLPNMAWHLAPLSSYVVGTMEARTRISKLGNPAATDTAVEILRADKQGG
eukprot:scaffold542223_cov19-Prasinocladus_malaysianus.AAC.1